MRSLINISFFVLVLFLLSCQQEISSLQAERFIKFHGNSLLNEAKDIEMLEDGSYAICGIDSVAGQGTRAFLLVLDDYGNLKPGFPKYYSDGIFSSGANALVVKRGGTGGFLLVGYVDKPQGDTIQKDLFLVRISLSGQEVWQKSFGSKEDESVLHATEMIAAGGFMLAGYQVQDGKTDIMVMGVTEEGDSIKLGLNYNNPFSDNAAANYILNTGEQYLCVCTYDKAGTEGTDILILNFDDELSPNDKILGGDFNEIGMCIVKDDEERYLILGNRMNASGRSEIEIHLIETDGLLITKTFLLETISESETDLIAKRFVKMEDGRIAIVGTIRSGGTSDIFLQFLNSEYQVANRIIYGSTGNQTGVDIDIPDDGGLIMLGTNSYSEHSVVSLIRTGDTGDL
jgi:hypothetical protein